MRFFLGKRGFSLIELMVAVMVLTIGLTGVAAMQLTALSEVFFANSNSTGSSTALAWAEWLTSHMNQTDQEKIVDSNTGMWNRANLFWLMSFDSNKTDTGYAEIQMPSTMADIVSFFNTTRTVVFTSGESKSVVFRKEGGAPFTAQDMPPPAPAGSILVLRIAANVPVVNTATIEVSLPYKNAFVKKMGATLHFVVASSM